jgi:hypothetical protein
LSPSMILLLPCGAHVREREPLEYNSYLTVHG